MKRHLRAVIRPAIKFAKFSVLHIDDSPQRIAMGVALGLFTAYLPLFGFHIILVLTIASILRANKFVALTFIWASNPFTFIPIYYPNYLLGRALFGWFWTAQRLGAEEVAGLFENFSFGRIVTGIYTTQFWGQFSSLVVQIGLEMLVGEVIIGGLIAVTSYFATCNIVNWYRKKHPHHRFQQQG